MSFFLKACICKISNKTGSTFEAHVKVNYTPKLIGKGTYTFSNIEGESYGDVGLRLNYIAFEFSYGLALRRKAIKETD